MLGKDLALLGIGQCLKHFRALQWIPDCPFELRIARFHARLDQQRVLEIRLVPDRVRATEHVELGFVRVARERFRIEHVANGRDEVIGIFAHDEEPDALRVGHVEVEHALDVGGLERIDCSLGVRATAEGHELHEQAIVE